MIMAKYAKIKTFDIANGAGVRTSIFFSGCPHHCKGCFNSDLWDPSVGEEFTREVYEKKIKPTIKEYVSGISVLGGEPYSSYNAPAVCELILWFKEDFPQKNIWLWTGYTLNQIKDKIEYGEMDSFAFTGCDYVVEGPFVEDLKDLSLKFRGSSNQNILNVEEICGRWRTLEKT